jgi:hypothetical protein
MREAAVAAAMAAVLGAGSAEAQQRAQDVNPSPMVPGSRAGDAPGMNPGTVGTDRGGAAASGQAGQANTANPSAMPPGSRAGAAPGMNPGSATGATSAQQGTAGQGAMPPGAASTPGVNPGAAGPQTTSPSERSTNPSAMPPGTRAGNAPGMNPGSGTTQGAPQAQQPGGTGLVEGMGRPGGTGANAPDAQPDVVPRGGTAATPATRPGQQAQPGQPATPRDGAIRDGTAAGAAAPARPAQGGGGTLASGANSFTEGQARDRISAAGFSDVQGLRLDEQGIWRGLAMRNGQQTGVAMDFQGNVAATQ